MFLNGCVFCLWLVDCCSCFPNVYSTVMSEILPGVHSHWISNFTGMGQWWLNSQLCSHCSSLHLILDHPWVFFTYGNDLLEHCHSSVQFCCSYHTVRFWRQSTLKSLSSRALGVSFIALTDWSSEIIRFTDLQTDHTIRCAKQLCLPLQSVTYTLISSLFVSQNAWYLIWKVSEPPYICSSEGTAVAKLMKEICLHTSYW